MLQQITDKIDTNIFSFYSDLKDQTIGGGTIPPDILVTAEKPDIVIIDRRVAHISGKPTVIIIELTCPWEERLEIARDLKSNKYSSLIHDIQATGHEVIFYPVEVGVRGIINKVNKSTIRDICDYFCAQTTASKLTKDISREAVTSSYHIFLNRNDKDWNNNFL